MSERANTFENRSLRSERGSAVLIALSLAVMIEIVIGLVIQDYAMELQANVSAKRSADKSTLQKTLSGFFVERDNCLALLNTTILRTTAPPTALPTAWTAPVAGSGGLSAISPELNAVATGAAGYLSVERYQEMRYLGPVASGSNSFLVDYWLSASPGNLIPARTAAYSSLQPWKFTASFAAFPVPRMSDFGVNEGFPLTTGANNITNVRRAFRSMVSSSLYIKRLVIFEVSPSATPPTSGMVWTGTDVPVMSTVGGVSTVNRSFHIWADFGLSSDASGITPSSGSVLNILAVRSGTGVSSCTTYDNARLVAPVSSGSGAQNCVVGKWMTVSNGTLACSP